MMTRNALIRFTTNVKKDDHCLYIKIIIKNSYNGVYNYYY